MIILFLIQLEQDKDYLSVYEGGSSNGKMLANMTGKKTDIEISTPRNQMFVVFNTNGNVVKKGFQAKILESMICIYFKYVNKGIFCL